MSHRELFRKSKIGNYHLRDNLGQGSYAMVYLGENIHLGIKAAIKVLNSHLGSEAKERFIQEARLITTLQHPHIVKLLDFGVEEDAPYLIMEYASERSLRQYFPPGTKLPL